MPGRRAFCDQLRRELDKKQRELEKLKEQLAIALSKEQVKSGAPAESTTAETTPAANSKEKPEEAKKEKSIEVESEMAEPTLKRRRKEKHDDDAASPASWQSKAESYHRRQGPGWVRYRCKEPCGRDAKSCEKPIHTLKTSAVADIVDRLRFKGKADLRGELQRGLEELERRGFKPPETSQEAVTLRKSLQQVEDGKIEAVPHELLRAPAEKEFTTSGSQVTEVEAALADGEAGGSEQNPEAPSVEQIPVETLRRMAQICWSYGIGRRACDRR